MVGLACSDYIHFSCFIFNTNPMDAIIIKMVAIVWWTDCRFETLFFVESVHTELIPLKKIKKLLQLLTQFNFKAWQFFCCIITYCSIRIQFLFLNEKLRSRVLYFRRIFLVLFAMNDKSFNSITQARHGCPFQIVRGNLDIWKFPMNCIRYFSNI